jgi:GT2 family glycosyltransferase
VYLEPSLYKYDKNNSLFLKKGMAVIKKEGLCEFLFRAWDYLKTNRQIILGKKSDYDRWIKNNSLSEERIAEIKHEIYGFHYKPKISVIMPVYNVSKIWLEKAINSVKFQFYENWELCIADDGSTTKYIRQTLERYARKEKRIKLKYLERNQGISGASNAALSMATGEFVAMLDNDDEISFNALYEYVKLLNNNQEADLIYSDEDKIDVKGNRQQPFFKPDYSPELLLSMNYVCHFSMFRKSLINDMGGFRYGYEGSQDYDLILRFVEKTKPERVFHIPKILYHWRKIPGSAAAITEAKDYAFVSAKKALSDYLERNNIDGEVFDGKFLGSYRVKRKILHNQKVSILIVFKDQLEALKTCTISILDKTNYRNYEIVLINNQSEQEKTFEYLERLRANPIIQIMGYDKVFNYSAINNYIISQLNSEYFILLSNNAEVISPDWIETMLEFGQRKDVGAVGTLLYSSNGKIRHAGIIVGIRGAAGNSHRYFRKNAMGYFGRIKLVQNLSAVSGACLMTKKSVFTKADGFDENLSHHFFDVDYCLRIRERGYQVIYTPYAELYHHNPESKSLEKYPDVKETFEKQKRYFQEKWEDLLTKGDPYYNPNLAIDKEDFSINV